MTRNPQHSDPAIQAIERLLHPLFSASAAVVVLRDDEVGELELPELRHRIIFNPARRQAFIAGRVAARMAMEKLGVEPKPVSVRDGYAPRWPTGVVGSISHARGHTVAVLERSRTVHGLGVDLQDLRPVRDGVLERITSAEETASLRLICHNRSEAASHVALAIKEAVFKALPAEQQKGLTIAAIRIEVPAFGQFRLESVAGKPPPGGLLVGRFGLSQDYVAAGFSLLADEPGR